MTLSDLRLLQSLPLEVKVAKSKMRIIEWIEHYGSESVYIAFSGGLGSTVLLYLVNEVCLEYGEPAIPALFVNTRNEFPEVVRHVYRMKAANNERFAKIVKKPYSGPLLFADQIEVRLPDRFLNQVLKEKGYLIASKKTSRCIHDARKIVAERPGDYYLSEKFQSLMNVKNKFSVPIKYRDFIFGDIEVSAECCHVLKRAVMERYEKESGRVFPFTGEQASESNLRQGVYLKHGCNGFDMAKPKSSPLGFWTSSDLCQYALQYHIPYPECYEKIVCLDGKYITTGEERTGCMICTAGIGKEKGKPVNRYQRMAMKHPVHYDYMLRSLEAGGCGMKPILEKMGIAYKPPLRELEIEELLDMIQS